MDKYNQEQYRRYFRSRRGPIPWYIYMEAFATVFFGTLLILAIIYTFVLWSVS